MNRDEIIERMEFFKENWLLLIWYVLISGLIYGIQVAMIVSMAKYAWKNS